MIIGNGMLATAFKGYNIDNILIFASGVSDSKTTNKLEFEREFELLNKTIDEYHDSIFIYFSSCSLSNSILQVDPYHIHKLKIENYIKKRVPKYLIFRLPNVVGFSKKDSRTLIPYLIKNISNTTRFEVWSGAKRNIIDLDDVVSIIMYIIHNKLYMNDVINIANFKNISVLELISKISDYLNMKPIFDIITTNQECFEINTDKIVHIVNNLDIHFTDDYVYTIIKKYY